MSFDMPVQILSVTTSAFHSSLMSNVSQPTLHLIDHCPILLQNACCIEPKELQDDKLVACMLVAPCASSWLRGTVGLHLQKAEA